MNDVDNAQLLLGSKSNTIDTNRLCHGQKLQDVDYFNTLGNFLEHSDEDEVDATQILDFLVRNGIKWQDGDKKASWLDVGAGPATKVIAVLKKWQELGRTDLPKIDLIEPSADWRKEAKQRFGTAGLKDLLNKMFPIKWEDYVSRNGFPNRFRLITFLHSIYGLRPSKTDLLDSLSSLTKLVEPNGWVCFAVESPKSDLYNIKCELFPHLGFTLINYALLENTFRRFEWEYIVGGDFSQKFYLAYHPCAREEALVNSEAMSFIVQTTPESYKRQLTTKETAAVRRVIGKWLKRDELGWYIYVPDRIYWTQCRRQNATDA